MLGKFLDPDSFPLSPATIDRCREHIQIKTVYISQPERATIQFDDTRFQPHETINLRLWRKNRDALRTRGYTVELRGPDEGHPRTHWLTLSCDDHTITVEYQHTLTLGGWILEIEARAKMSRGLVDSAGEIEAEPSSVGWWDYTGATPWDALLAARNVAFTLGPMKVVLTLDLDWTAPSHYSLRVEIVTEMRLTAPAAPLESAQGEEHPVSSSGDRADA